MRMKPSDSEDAGSLVLLYHWDALPPQGWSCGACQISGLVHMSGRRLTATMMAGFGATLAGTEMYIWTLVGLEPKPVTCWRAAKAEPAVASMASAEVNAFIVMLPL
jgi:hypothetical protein